MVFFINFFSSKVAHGLILGYFKYTEIAHESILLHFSELENQISVLNTCIVIIDVDVIFTLAIRNGLYSQLIIHIYLLFI